MVEEHVPGAGVKPGDGGLVPRNGHERHVGDAADVEKRRRQVASEHLRVEGGHQGGAFPSGRDVAATEVRDDVDSGELREERRVVELNREAPLRAVADRLTVAPDRVDRAAREARGPEERFNDFRPVARERHRGVSHAFDLVGGVAQGEREEVAA